MNHDSGLSQIHVMCYKYSPLCGFTFMNLEPLKEKCSRHQDEVRAQLTQEMQYGITNDAIQFQTNIHTQWKIEN